MPFEYGSVKRGSSELKLKMIFAGDHAVFELRAIFPRIETESDQHEAACCIGATSLWHLFTKAGGMGVRPVAVWGGESLRSN